MFGSLEYSIGSDWIGAAAGLGGPVCLVNFGMPHQLTGMITIIEEYYTVIIISRSTVTLHIKPKHIPGLELQLVLR